MDSNKRVKLSLRVSKEKKTLDFDTISDCIGNEAARPEFEGLERSLKPVSHRPKQSCSSQNQHNSEIISCPSKNVSQRLTTWTPLPDLQWNELDNSAQAAKINTENQTRNTCSSFSNDYSQVPRNGWIPLPMPCLRCLCRCSPSSKFTKRPASKSDNALIKNSKLVHDSKNDTRKVDSILPEVLSNPENLLSTKSVVFGTSSVSCNAKGQANILRTSESHLPGRRKLEVDSRRGPDIEHSNKFVFDGPDQPPHQNDLFILQNRPMWTPKAKSCLTICEASSNVQISASSEKLHITNNVSSHSAPKSLKSIPNPPDWCNKDDGSSPLEHRGVAPDVLTLNALEKSCAKGQVSSSTLWLQQCPLCAVQFQSSLGQIERDSHIAACLSAAEDDVAW